MWKLLRHIRCRELCEREKELLKLRRNWIPPVLFVSIPNTAYGAGAMPAVEFRRGFIKAIATTRELLVKSAGELFQSHPVTKVVLSDIAPDYNRVNRFWTVEVDPCTFWESPARTRAEGDNLHFKALRLHEMLVYATRYVEFKSREEAQEAVSRAAVNFGREIVKLPPLTDQARPPSPAPALPA